jgi:hypothetical protein
MKLEPQTETVKFRKSTKSKRLILKSQFFQGLNDSEMEEELMRCWYKHNKKTAS